MTNPKHQTKHETLKKKIYEASISKTSTNPIVGIYKRARKHLITFKSGLFTSEAKFQLLKVIGLVTGN